MAKQYRTARIIRTEPKVTEETAIGATIRLRNEAHRRIMLLTEAIRTKFPTTAKADWGHVGDLEQINSLLAHVLHHAGVAEFVEK